MVVEEDRLRLALVAEVAVEHRLKLVVEVVEVEGRLLQVVGARVLMRLGGEEVVVEAQSLDWQACEVVAEEACPRLLHWGLGMKCRVAEVAEDLLSERAAAVGQRVCVAR